jgi:hypothetical protein
LHIILWLRNANRRQLQELATAHSRLEEL